MNAVRTRLAIASVVLVAAASTAVGASTESGSAHVTVAHSHRAPATTTTPIPNPWADTVQIDAIDGDTLSVHSVRHSELAPYTVQADQNTIFQRVPGSLFAPQPGLQVGSTFYFTGIGSTAGSPPPSVHALRIFP